MWVKSIKWPCVFFALGLALHFGATECFAKGFLELLCGPRISNESVASLSDLQFPARDLTEYIETTLARVPRTWFSDDLPENYESNSVFAMVRDLKKIIRATWPWKVAFVNEQRLNDMRDQQAQASLLIRDLLTAVARGGQLEEIPLRKALYRLVQTLRENEQAMLAATWSGALLRPQPRGNLLKLRYRLVAGRRWRALANLLSQYGVTRLQTDALVN